MSSYGLTDWDEPSAGQNKFSDEERIPFLKLKDGKNIMRIIAGPYRYNHIKFKLNKDDKGFGERINCSWPLEDDPGVKAGFSPKHRYMVGVISREEDENRVRIYDMSVLVYQHLQQLKDDVEWGNPTEFDINVRKNSKAPAAGYYTVLPRNKAPLSEADVALRDSVMEQLTAQLARLTTPVKPETVLKRMEALGYKGGVIVGNDANGAAELTDANDQSFDFSASAQA